MSIQNIYLYIMFYIFTHRSENHQGLSLVVAMLLKNIPSTLIASNKHWGFIPLTNVDGEMLVLLPVWGYLSDIPALQSLQAAEDSLWGNKTAV